MNSKVKSIAYGREAYVKNMHIRYVIAAVGIAFVIVATLLTVVILAANAAR